MEMPTLQREVMSKRERGDLPTPSKFPMAWGRREELIPGTWVSPHWNKDRGLDVLSQPLSKTGIGEWAEGNHAWRTKPCPAIPADNWAGSLWKLVEAARGFYAGSPSCRTQKSSEEKMKTTPH